MYFESMRQLVSDKAHHYVWTRFILDSLEIAVKELNQLIPIYATGISGCDRYVTQIIEEKIKAFSGGAAQLLYLF